MAGPTDAIRLAELVCARISHDLGGLIGTLHGALELAADDPATANEALDIAGQAAGELRRRLEWMRVAWGAGGSAMSVPALQALAAGMPKAERVALDFARLAPDAMFSPHVARALLNLLLLAANTLGGRGNVIVTGDGRAVVVAIAGPHAAWPADLLACLAREDAAWAALRDARSLLPPLIALLIRGCGLHVVPVAPEPGESIPRLRLAEL